MTPKDRAEVEEAMKNPAIPALVREEVLKSVAERTKTRAAKKAGPNWLADVPSRSPAQVVGAIHRRTIRRWIFPELAKAQSEREDRSPRKQRATSAQDAARQHLDHDAFLHSALRAGPEGPLPPSTPLLHRATSSTRCTFIPFFYIATLLTVFSAMAASHWAPALEAPLVWLCVLAIVAQVFLSIRKVYRQRWFLTDVQVFLWRLHLPVCYYPCAGDHRGRDDRSGLRKSRLPYRENFSSLFLRVLGGVFAVVAGVDKLAFEARRCGLGAKADGTDAKKIADGASPELSPDGKPTRV